MTAPSGHLILIGLPGSGKSTVGRSVARSLGWPFIDFDNEIERRVGVPVHEIFSRQGEATFRQLERDLTVELASAEPMVLAPGGGWIANEGVVELVRPPARLIHLRISPELAVRRLSRARTVRPLLAGPDPLKKMRELWERRSALYARADLEIDVELVDSQRVVEIAAEFARGLTPGIG